MKKIGIIAFLCLMVFSGSAQDKIYLNDNSVISAKISEITVTDVKYKKWDNLTGPDYILPKSEITMIMYQNGTHEVINQTKKNEEITMIDVLPYWKSGKNIIGANYFDIIYKNVTLNYTRLLCGQNFSIGLSASAGLTYRNSSYSYGSSFLNFDRDYFHGILSFNYFPTGMNKISYYTGLSVMTGVGGDFVYDYFEPLILDKKTYYGVYINNGVIFNLTKHFNMKAALALGMADRDMNGDFQTHAVFDLSAGIRF